MAKDKRIVAGVISDTKYYYASDGSVVDEDGKPAPAKFAAMFPPMPEQKSEEPKEKKPKKTRRKLRELAGKIKNSKYYYDAEGNVVDEEGKPVNEKLASYFDKREELRKALPKVEPKKQTNMIDERKFRIINSEIGKAIRNTQNLFHSNEIIQDKMTTLFDSYNDVVKTLGDQNDAIIQRLIQQNQDFQDKVIETLTGVPAATKAGGAKPRKINPRAVGGSKAARGTELKVKTTNYRETRKQEVEDRARRIAAIKTKRDVQSIVVGSLLGATAGVGAGAIISAITPNQNMPSAPGGAAPNAPAGSMTVPPSNVPLGSSKVAEGGAGEKPTGKAGFNQIMESAKKAGDPFPEVVAAQWAIESGWGKHMTGKNNPFGQTGVEGKDPGIRIPTPRDPGGGSKFFRSFESIDEAVAFRVKKWAPKYANAKTAEEALMMLQNYGRTPRYAQGYNNDWMSYVTSVSGVIRGQGIDPKVAKGPGGGTPGSPQPTQTASGPSAPAGSPQIASAPAQPQTGTGGVGSIQAPGGSPELTVKGGMNGQAFAGGAVHPATLKLAGMIQSSVQGFDRFTGFNDKYHEGTNSRHAKGLAGDFTVSNPAYSAAAAEQVRALAKQLGASVYVIDEYKNPSSRATAGHIHYQFTDQRSADLVMGQGQTQVAAAGEPPKAYAAGDPYVPNTGPAIVGERGPELVVGKDGSSRVTGAGAHVENLNQGDSVVPADKTKQLMGYAEGTRAASTIAGSLNKNFTAPEDTGGWTNLSREEKVALMTLNKRANGDNTNITQILQQKNSPQYATELERATKRFEGEKSFGNFGTIDRKLIEESEGKINAYAEAYKPTVVRQETTYDIMGNATQPAVQYEVQKTAEEKQQALQQHREQQSNAYDALSQAMSASEPDNSILSNLSYALGISSKEKETSEAKKAFGMPNKMQKYADGTKPPKKTGKPIKQPEPVDNTAEIGLSLLKTGVSFIPGVGQVVAGLDAANELRKGNIGGALKAGIGAIPGGNIAAGVGKMVAGEVIDRVDNKLSTNSEQNAIKEYTKPPAVKTVVINNNRTNNVTKTVSQGSSLPQTDRTESANPLAQGGNKRTAMGAF
jgi:hypothetical protein